MATIKQRRAIENMVGNGGNITAAMIEAGYSPNTAHTPQKLTESKECKELLAKYLPTGELLEEHHSQVHATKIFSSHTEPDREVPDNTSRLKALELAYKLKGMFDPEVQINQQFNDLKIELVCDDK